jgi:hypothetical protein
MRKRAVISGNGRPVVILIMILTIFLSASLSLAANTTAQSVPQPTDDFAWFRSGGEDSVNGRAFTRASELLPASDLTPSSAASMTFTPVADTDLVENFPDLNTGETTEIWAGYDDRPDYMGGILRGLLKADDPGLF